MDQHSAQKFIDEMWMDSIVPELIEYVRIPAKSPHFDPDWEANGYVEDAVQQIHTWCAGQDVQGMQIEIVRLEIEPPELLARERLGRRREVVRVELERLAWR